MADRLQGNTVFALPAERFLNSGDLRVVYEELYQVRAKWRPIGIELNLAPGTLDAIQLMSGNPGFWLEKVLTEWLNNETATWRELVDTLKSVPVGEKNLAKQLEEKYCGFHYYEF